MITVVDIDPMCDFNIRAPTASKHHNQTLPLAHETNILSCLNISIARIIPTLNSLFILRTQRSLAHSRYNTKYLLFLV